MHNFSQLRGYGSKSCIQKSPTINHLGLPGNEPCKHSRKCIKTSILFSYVLIVLHVLFVLCVLSFVLSYLFSHFHCSLNSLFPLSSLCSPVLSVLSVLSSSLFSQFSCPLFSQFSHPDCSLNSHVLSVLSVLLSCLFSLLSCPVCSPVLSVLSVLPSSQFSRHLSSPVSLFSQFSHSVIDSDSQ